MFLLTFALGAFFMHSIASPILVHPLGDFRSTLSDPSTPNITIRPAASFQPASYLSVSSNILPLTSLSSTTSSHLRRPFLPSYSPGNSSTLLSIVESSAFSTAITVDSQTFQVLIDTGSSDLWLITNPYTCVDVSTHSITPNEDCYFGPTYKSDKFHPRRIANYNFNITYGSGEKLGGGVGIGSVSLAGMNVNQEMGFVTYAAWQGDGVTSGLMGLAYSTITSAYHGTNPTQDGSSPATAQAPYSSLFQTLYSTRASQPVFSLALERQTSGPAGYLAFGGLPPVNVTGNWTSTPILITTIQGYPRTYDFYTIQVNSVNIGGKNWRGGNYIVDSGTTLAYLPSPLASIITKTYSPPATWSSSDGVFYVPCHATAPIVSFSIGGSYITVNPLDMIVYAGTDENGQDACISGINDGGNDPGRDLYILGDSFLKSVVAVFDVGAGHMRFAEREYASDDPY